MFRSIWVAGIALWMGFVFLLSCGQSDEEAAVEKAIEEEIGGDVKAEISGEKMVIKTEGGEMTIDASGGAKVPDSFPKDVLVYKGAAVGMSMSQPDGVVLSLSTPDEIEKVKAAYGKSMSSNGWAEESNFQMGTQSMISYKKDDRTATVMLAEDQGKTNINLTVNSR